MFSNDAAMLCQRCKETVAWDLTPAASLDALDQAVGELPPTLTSRSVPPVRRTILLHLSNKPFSNLRAAITSWFGRSPSLDCTFNTRH